MSSAPSQRARTRDALPHRLAASRTTENRGVSPERSTANYMASDLLAMYAVIGANSTAQNLLAVPWPCRSPDACKPPLSVSADQRGRQAKY
jgi:hypothetical protein